MLNLYGLCMVKRCMGLLCLAALFGFFALAGCGSDGGPAPGFGEDGRPVSVFDTLVVQSSGDLPQCDGSHDGRAFFVRNDNGPFLCVGGTWRKASDSTDFSVTCEGGFLRVSSRAPGQDGLGDASSAAVRRLSGAAQKGPFMFGSSVQVYAADSMNFYRTSGNPVASGCMLSNDGRYDIAYGAELGGGNSAGFDGSANYNGWNGGANSNFNSNFNSNGSVVKVTVSGFYRNEVNGGYSASPVSLSLLTDLASAESLNVNVVSHLEIPRIEQLAMNHVPFAAAKAQAEREIFAAFGIDATELFSQQYFQDASRGAPLSGDLNMLGNSDYSAAVLAISAMLLGDRGEGDMMNLLNNVAEDIKGDGVWNDPNWKIRIADWIVGLDSSWKYNDVRNSVSSWGLGPVPNFEKYMRAFFPAAYGFEACNAATAGLVTFVKNGQSAYFANDMKHVDHSRVRFICDANSLQWRVANAFEKDTAGFGAGEYDREIREGNINYDKFYIYESAKGAWREATAQEADGFTDIGDVFANLKSNETVVFIVRHAERTDDTSEKGHLTSNGMKQAQSVGAKLVGLEDFYFGYSGFTRTRETVENIAAGRGQQGAAFEVLDWLNGDWYVKDASRESAYKSSDGGGWAVVSRYAFTGAYDDAYYDLETRSEELVSKILMALPSMKRVNVLCTHDTYLVPLLAYVTDGHANVRYYEKNRWLNYLAGVAMIVSPNGDVRYVPVKGLDSGTM